MALSDLRVSGLEHYGGVDLKRSYRRFFSEGIAVSIGLHLLVLLLYVAYNFLTIEPSYIYPILRRIGVVVTIPPPSIISEAPLPAATTVAKRPPSPNDIPVPVPKLIEPGEPSRLLSVGMPTNDPVIVTATEPQIALPRLEIKNKPSGSIGPDKTVWQDLSEEPRPVQDIQQLVEYPQNARRTNIEGRVTVSALIGEDGRVVRVEVEHADHPWLTQAAVDAMMKVRFTPARQGAESVKAWYTQTIQFKLNTN